MKEIIVPNKYFSSVLEPNREEPLVLTVHSGFPTFEEAHEQACRLGLKDELYAMVRFLDGWYVVVFDTLEKEAVIGAELAWYRTGIQNPLKPEPLEEFTLPWQVKKLSKPSSNWKAGVYEDLKKADENLACFVKREKSKGYSRVENYVYARAYIILLGITFYERWWSVEKCHIELEPYFADAKYWKYEFSSNVKAISPFRGKILLSDGTEQIYNFYKGYPNNW